MLSKTFKQKFKALKCDLGLKLCLCGKVSDTHCRSFTDNVWFGCLKSKPIIEKKDEKDASI